MRFGESEPTPHSLLALVCTDTVADLVARADSEALSKIDNQCVKNIEWKTVAGRKAAKRSYAADSDATKAAQALANAIQIATPPKHVHKRATVFFDETLKLPYEMKRKQQAKKTSTKKKNVKSRDKKKNDDSKLKQKRVKRHAQSIVASETNAAGAGDSDGSGKGKDSAAAGSGDRARPHMKQPKAISKQTTSVGELMTKEGEFSCVERF